MRQGITMYGIRPKPAPKRSAPDQSSWSFRVTSALSDRFATSTGVFGLLAFDAARSSARAARYFLRPPFLVTSRLTVEGGPSSREAIARMLRPLASPREISSRSRSDSEVSRRFLLAGEMPPVAARTPKIEAACFPSVLPISLSDSPRRHRFQSSFFCFSESPGRPRCAIDGVVPRVALTV